MKPAPFKYCAPTVLDEVYRILEEYGDEARILAGGQSLIPLMNMRLAQPSVIVDIGKVPELVGIDADNGVTIGAMTSHLAVRQSTTVQQKLPLVSRALEHVGHAAIQSRGTFGGSIAHADPAAELPAVVLALDATIHASSRSGTRAIPADAFFLSTFTTALEQHEVLTSVRLPVSPPERVYSYMAVSRRHGDFALVGVAAVADIGQDRSFDSVRLVLSSVSDTPFRTEASEAYLRNKPVTLEAMREAARLTVDAINPVGDIHASSEYRRHVAGTLIVRALADLAKQAGIDTHQETTR